MGVGCHVEAKRNISMLGISKDSTYLSLREALASRQPTVCEARIMGILCPLIASLTLAMTKNNIRGVESSTQWVRLKSHLQIF